MSLLDVINIPTFNLNILISNPFSSNNFIGLWMLGFIFTDTRRSKINILLYTVLNSIAKDARVRAEAIALQAGSEVGGLKRVNTGVFQITVPNSTKVSSWGSYDTSTIKKDITAVMGVTFAVK